MLAHSLFMKRMWDFQAVMWDNVVYFY